MTAQHSSQSDEAVRQLRDALIRARLAPLSSYAFFFCSGEGRFIPGTSVEESSGYVLDERGGVHYFRFGWDAAAAAPALLEWEAEEPSPGWQADVEYLQARERVGVASQAR